LKKGRNEIKVFYKLKIKIKIFTLMENIYFFCRLNEDKLNKYAVKNRTVLNGSVCKRRFEPFFNAVSKIPGGLLLKKAKNGPVNTFLHKPENSTDLLENHFRGQKHCWKCDPD
jgi:hypothetical protein